MKTFITEDAEEINNLIVYLNFFHDACMRRICFHKDREVDKQDGSLIYPYENISDFAICDIEIELIHNNYQEAKKDQIIFLKFNETTAFSFNQGKSADFSDIFEMEFKSDEEGQLKFVFYLSKEKISFLSIHCKKFLFAAK